MAQDALDIGRHLGLIGRLISRFVRIIEQVAGLVDRNLRDVHPVQRRILRGKDPAKIFTVDLIFDGIGEAGDLLGHGGPGAEGVVSRLHIIPHAGQLRVHL